MSLVPRAISFDAVWSGECEGPLQSLFCRASLDGTCGAPVQEATVSAALLYNKLYHLSVATPRDHLLDVYRRLGMLFCITQKIDGGAHQPSQIVATYAACWRAYSSAVRRINALAMYINKVILKMGNDHLPRNVSIVIVDGERMQVRVRPIKALGMHIWKDAILVHSREQQQNVLVAAILACILALRQEAGAATAGQAILLADLETAIKSFHESDPRAFATLSVAGEEAPPAGGAPLTAEGSDGASFYEAELEGPLIDGTRAFYVTESTAKIASGPITAYIHYAENRLREELQWAKTLLPLSSTLRVVAAVEAQLILAHTERLQADFSLLLESGNIEELAIVFRLVKRIPDGIEPLAASFEAFVLAEATRSAAAIREHYTEDGTAILPLRRADVGVGGFYVAQLGETLRTFKGIVRESFEKDSRFAACIKRAFRRILQSPVPCSAGILPPALLTQQRHPEALPPLVLADFFDRLLQDCIAPDRIRYDDVNMTSDQIFRAFLDDGIALVRHLEDKEAFVAAYVERLANRLIYRLSRHGDAEGELIEQLKAICGNEAGVRMEKMLMDMHHSHSVKESFEAHLREGDEPSLPYQVAVSLPTYIVWPLRRAESFAGDPSYVLPAPLARIAGHFEAFYKRLSPNRQLEWLHHLSRVTMSHADASGRVHELITNIPQCQILCAFQAHSVRPAALLMDLCRCSWPDLVLLLSPIVAVGLLRWSPSRAMEEVEGDEAPHLEYVAEWTHSRTRIKLCSFSCDGTIASMRAAFEEPAEGSPLTASLPPPSPAPFSGHDMQIDDSVHFPEARKLQVQAATVKILKAHAQVSPARLYQLAAEQAALSPPRDGPPAFALTHSHFHSVLDVLIDKQYVEYSEESDLYVYIP